MQEWVASKKTYICRFGVMGMLLSYYLDEAFAPEYLALPAAVSSEGILRQYDDLAWYYAARLQSSGATIPYPAGKPAVGVGTQQDNPEGARKLPDRRRAEEEYLKDCSGGGGGINN